MKVLLKQLGYANLEYVPAQFKIETAATSAFSKLPALLLKTLGFYMVLSMLWWLLLIKRIVFLYNLFLKNSFNIKFIIIQKIVFYIRFRVNY